MKELYQFLVWLVLALIYMCVLFSFPEYIKSENTIIILVISFIGGLICRFLAKVIINKFYKK